MSFFDKLLVAAGLREEAKSANSAKERLQVVVSHQRRHRNSPDYLPMLEKDILAVIAKYVEIDEEKVNIRFDRGDDSTSLVVDVDLPMISNMQARQRALAGDDFAPRSSRFDQSDERKRESAF